MASTCQRSAGHARLKRDAVRVAAQGKQTDLRDEVVRLQMI